MIQTFLTGHTGSGLRALGVRGLPVTDYSEQIHALLCLRGMSNIADCFAVPLRIHHQHDLQWYSPLRGEITVWTEADVQQKHRALLVLEQAFTAIEQLSEHCQASHTPAGAFFSRLLDKMTSFPGEEAIYLVNNQPVITFWSYRLNDCHLSGRQLTEKSLAALSSQLPAADNPEFAQQSSPLLMPVPDNHLLLPSAEQALKSPQTSLWLATTLIVGIILIITAGYFLGDYLYTSQQILTKVSTTPAGKIQVTTSHKSLPDIRLPLQPSTLQPPASPPPSAVKSSPVEHRLQLSASSVKMGDIRVMDGDWRAIIPGPEGNSQLLLFRFKQGRGEVRFDLPKQGHCKAESRSGFLPSGTLALRSRYTASCQDGSRIRVPAVNCTRSTTGTQCSTTADAVPPGQTVILSAAGVR
ncbi:SrfA family protein [Tatumella sp. UBA2305]|uniref:SrfA family protein n=1 Tax=Tatumella sp. UBA2305 TaxID=1947647 RepID=UPI0025E8823B|nr:SrfA family protein [Tatumella sp. UBA2305]